MLQAKKHWILQILNIPKNKCLFNNHSMDAIWWNLMTLALFGIVKDTQP